MGRLFLRRRHRFGRHCPGRNGAHFSQLRQSGDAAHIAAAIPDAWIDQLAIVGAKEDWTAAIDRYVEAGANSIFFVTAPDKGPQELERFRHNLAG